jgi:hypothetical protein
MTKDEATIARLVRELDLERHKRVQAERRTQALRMVIARMKAQRHATKQPEPDRPHVC